MKVFVTACLFAGIIVLPAKADIIYFKDGMKTICQEKAWEEDGEIKCEYAGWIISYQKNDVLRIVSTTRKKKTTQAEKKPPVSPTTTKGSAEKKIKSPLPKTTGPVFYNPRRPYIYWAGINSKHKSYKEAIQSLAKKYERSPEWVKANMGATNDLKQINQNLRDRKAADPAG